MKKIFGALCLVVVLAFPAAAEEIDCEKYAPLVELYLKQRTAGEMDSFRIVVSPEVTALSWEDAAYLAKPASWFNEVMDTLLITEYCSSGKKTKIILLLQGGKAFAVRSVDLR